jgi:hypothetical protein
LKDVLLRALIDQRLKNENELLNLVWGLDIAGYWLRAEKGRLAKSKKLRERWLRAENGWLDELRSERCLA